MTMTNKHSSHSQFGPRMAALLTLLLPCTATAQPYEVYSIADQIKADNDCSDRNNAECKSLFETTCTWAGDTSITLRDGIAQGIPFDRIAVKVIGELGEVAEGSGGYVDLDLANSMIEPMGMYFITGQYDADFAQFNDQAGMAFAMMLGAQINGSAKKGFANETMAEANKRRDDLLRQKWFSTCMQAAYF